MYKNKKRISIFITLIIMAVLFVACDIKTKESESGVTVYLVNATQDGLTSINVDLEGDNKEDRVKEIIDILYTGVSESNIAPTIPNFVGITSISFENNNVILDFSSGYEALGDVQEILFRSAIVKSLTELHEVETVEFYVLGYPKLGSNGLELGKMGKDDVVYDSMIKDNISKITLYFADKNGEYLIPEEVSINLNVNAQIERMILNKLIEGPANTDLVRTVPTETKIKDIYTNEGICYVDFTKEFRTKHMGGSAGELLTIYSIVNSLTELDSINRVQFLIEGKIEEEYKGHVKFDEPFTRNLDLIKK